MYTNGTSMNWVYNNKGKMTSPVAMVLTALLLFSACIKEITLEVPEENSPNIAIRGRLLGGDLPVVTVKITSITDFRPSSIPIPVTGASVVLIDEFNRGVDIPMRGPGIYELVIPPGAFELEVKPGAAYQLSVSTPGGRNYLSTFEPLHTVPEPTEIRYTSTRRDVLNEANNIVDREFIQFLLTTPLVTPTNGTRSYLKWDFIGTYRFPESTLAGAFPPQTKTCYITEFLNLEKVIVFDGTKASQDILHDFFLLDEPFNYRFSNGFYLTVRQQSLSENAFRYWDEVSNVVNITGNFFEAPPGKVKGNFRNVDDAEEEVAGFFYASEETIFRLYVDPGNDPPMPFCPLTAPSAASVDTTCTDCLLRANSTTVKPDFWEE